MRSAIKPENDVKVLLVEDDLVEARLLHEILKNFHLNKFNLVHVTRLREALKYLEQDAYDVILLDLTLPDSQGLDSLQTIVRFAPRLPVVVLTNTNDDQLAIEAVRQGAQDYLVKRNINVEGLVRSLQYAIERKRVNETLMQANETLVNSIQEKNSQLAEAEKINQFKTEFLSMFSHDFRNPLTTILVSAGLLEEKKELLSEQRQELLLKQIRSAGKSLSQLLDEIIVIGHSDAGKLPYNPEPLNIQSYCKQLIEEFKITTGNKHKLNFISEGIFTDALWDINLLQHILDNLLINAIKYSPEGSLIEFKIIAQENTVTLTVKDEGIGIPSEQIDRLFIPFNRASNVRHIPGTGLGLAIVKRCVEVQKGEISLTSQEGLGTTFKVVLPIVKVDKR
ncbi:MAG: hybrid sensor histidine kinase/response regulator [Xenococcaceae cyanobacterium MO_167.B27]|nr:hybrid sensor histidine kinase/response regulator [Xenococcaceae cyanobacterium MO_167.B27]